MSLWQDKFIKINPYSRSGKKLIQVRKIVIHWTANFGATASNHYTYFNNLVGRFASAHLFVDKKEALCIIPLNELAFHANDGSTKKIPELKPNANQYSIGIEMCVEKDGSIHPNTIKQTEDIATELCKRYGLNPLTDIVRHFDVTGKSCPAPWVKDSLLFTNFKNNVNTKRGNKTVIPNPTPSTDIDVTVDGVIEVLVDNLNLRSDSNFNASIVRTLPKGSKWKVFRLKNGMYNLGGNQWCSAGGAYVKFTSSSTPTPTPIQNTPPSSTTGILEVIVDRLNLRKSSNTNSPILRVLNKGEKYKVFGLENNMYNVGNSWVSASPKYVKFTPSGGNLGRVKITTYSLNIRKNSNTSSTIVGVALKGQTFPIYEKSNGMYRIGDNKWISASEKYVELI